MPGVLLIEAMAQTSGWLVIGGTSSRRMPFLAALKEAKLRTFVTPGQVLVVRAKLVHEGSGFAITKAEIDVDGKTVCDAELTFRVVAFPDRDSATSMERGRAAHRVSRWKRADPWLNMLTRARPGSPASASCRASAKGPTRIGRRLTLARSPGRQRRTYRALHRASARAARISTRRSRRRATSGRWSRGSASAPMRRASRSTAPASRATPTCSARMDMIVAAGGGERDIAADTAILSGLPRRREAGSLPQRTADERPAPDAVPGAALQPARRQYLDRAWRHRLVAHLHGRGSRRRRCGPHRAVARSSPARATSRWSAAPQLRAPDVLMLYEFGGYLRQG